MHDTFQLPIPQNPGVFEDLVCDLLSRRYRNYSLQRYGRSGQEQWGVDIVGVVAAVEVIGAQCKHTPKGLSENTILKEVAKAEKFVPALDHYLIATTAPRDTHVQDFVMAYSQQRVAEDKFPVEVLFWDSLCSELSGYPDLLYKYFTRHYPQLEQLSVALPGIQAPCPSKLTLRWPAQVEDLRRTLSLTSNSIPLGVDSPLALGVTEFGQDMEGVVDLLVQLEGAHVGHCAQVFREVRGVVQKVGGSKRLTVFANVHLPTAVVLGWMFRSVAGFRLSVVAGSSDQVWTTSDVPLMRSGLVDELPQLFDSTNREIVVVLNISRNLQHTVAEFVSTWQHKPRAMVGWTLQGEVRNTVHAASIAIEVTDRLKQIDDVWNAERIHMFAAMPAALAVLIGHHLNRLCPIDLYYNQVGSVYEVGVTLSQDLETMHGHTYKPV